jgi:hypothetical protein
LSIILAVAIAGLSWAWAAIGNATMAKAAATFDAYIVFSLNGMTAAEWERMGRDFRSAMHLRRGCNTARMEFFQRIVGSGDGGTSLLRPGG